jgi:hypothetical protein
MVVSAHGGTYLESCQLRQSLVSLKSSVVDKLLAHFDKQVADSTAAPRVATRGLASRVCPCRPTATTS